MPWKYWSLHCLISFHGLLNYWFIWGSRERAHETNFLVWLNFQKFKRAQNFALYILLLLQSISSFKLSYNKIIHLGTWCLPYKSLVSKFVKEVWSLNYGAQVKQVWFVGRVSRYGSRQSLFCTPFHVHLWGKFLLDNTVKLVRVCSASSLDRRRSQILHTRLHSIFVCIYTVISVF